MLANTSIRWRAYPALLLAGGFALGIWCKVAWQTLGLWTWTFAAVLFAVLASVLLLWPRQRVVTLAPLGIAFLLGLLAVALGGARTTLYTQLDRGHLAHLLPDDASIANTTLTGRIVGPVVHPARGARFTLQADSLVYGIDALAINGKVRVFLRPSRWQPEATFPRVQQGDHVRLRGRLEAAPAPRNPADFDYGAYLRRRDIHAILSVYEPSHAEVRGRSNWPLVQVLTATRAHIGRQIRRHVEAPTSQAVLRALLLGDRSRISDATEQHFVATGLLHLLAISGLHVLLVGMVVYTLLRPLLMRLRLPWRAVELVRAVATFLLLSGFALVAGGRPSVVRAVVMAVLFIGGNVLQRSSHPLNTLGVAALVLLGTRPTALFDAGFQLSFSAVGAIIALNPRLLAVLPPRWRHDGWRAQLAGLVTVSLAATLGTMPVLLVHFGYVSFAGLVLNVPAIPLTALTLLGGLLLTVTGGWLPVAPLFGAAAELLTRGLLFTASTGEDWLGWAALEATVRNPWMVLALVSGLLVVAQWPRPRLRWRMLAVALCFLAVGTWIRVLTQPDEAYLDVLFFDVGQGDAALITFPNGRHLLVDAGPRSPYFDAASSVLLPHFERYDINRLDVVAISHSDSDHLGGLPTLLRSIPVGRVVLSRQRADTELLAETRHLLDSLEVPHEQLHVGDTLAVDPAAYVQVLAPPRTFSFADDNDASLVLRVTYGGTRLLFTGDVEKSAERWLVEHLGATLRSELVKVSHHGSGTSSTPEFVRLARTDTMLAVVSVGRENAFGLPDSSVLRRWRNGGSRVLTTAETGAIWLRTNGGTVERLRWR